LKSEELVFALLSLWSSFLEIEGRILRGNELIHAQVEDVLFCKRQLGSSSKSKKSHKSHNHSKKSKSKHSKKSKSKHSKTSKYSKRESFWSPVYALILMGLIRAYIFYIVTILLLLSMQSSYDQVVGSIVQDCCYIYRTMEDLWSNDGANEREI